MHTLAKAEEDPISNNFGKADELNASFSYVDKNIDGTYPNMFITNHDLVRFGDMIQRSGKGNYWERHRAAISFLNAYTGPITLYYGDEWGAEVSNDGSYANDNESRSPGKISGFNTEEQSLVNYTAKLMAIRKEHPALWRGKRTNLIASGQQYADLKTDTKTGDMFRAEVASGSERGQIIETYISAGNILRFAMRQ